MKAMRNDRFSYDLLIKNNASGLVPNLYYAC